MSNTLDDLELPARSVFSNIRNSARAATVRTLIGSLLSNLQEITGDTALADLTTTVKTSLIAAINELVTSLGDTDTNVAAVIARYENGAATRAIIAQATANGKLKTSAPCDFRVGGRLYTKSNTDDLWDLSAQTALGAAEYKAFWLYLSTAGAASIAAGSVAASEAAAIAALPAVDATKSVIGCFVAGPNTNFANALGAQGTIIDGWPASVA